MRGRRLVAVYGTLKQDFENYERHLAGELPLLATTARLPYRMYANGEYPMLVPDEAAHPVAVEVYAVSEAKLAELDALEGPYGYGREKIRLDSLEEDIELYVHPGPAPMGFVLVSDGDWRG